MSDYYQALGVERTASADDIKRAYRKLAVKYHPDKNPGDSEAEQHFKKISEAYDILSDESKRRMYDQYGESAFQGGGAPGGFGGGAGGFASMEDALKTFMGAFGGGQGGGESIFDSFFGGGGFDGGGGQGGQYAQQGASKKTTVTISFLLLMMLPALGGHCCRHQQSEQTIQRELRESSEAASEST